MKKFLFQEFPRPAPSAGGRASAYLCCLLAVLALTLPGAAAQPAPPAGLSIGDPVPDVALAGLVHYPAPTARLSDFRGKWLLLDFWATWCGTCKANMPRLDALQKQFPDELRVLLATRDDDARVRAYFKKWKNEDGTPYRLPSVVGDTALGTLFPYRLVPHVVWIGPDGTVQAITGADQVTPENVRLAIAHGTMPAVVKKDIDLRRPLFAGGDLPADKLVYYGILLKGKISGLPSGSRLRERDGVVCGRAVTNRPLLDLYQTVALAQLPAYTPHRLVLEVRDPGQLLPAASADSLAAWEQAHFYSYDQVGPPAAAGRLYDRMLEDLNRYSGYHGSLEKRRVPCLVLRRTGSAANLETKGGPTESTLYAHGLKRLRNAPLAYLIAQLLSEESIRLPVLDETGIRGRVDLDLRAPLADLPALRQELRRYHLALEEAEREIDVLVVRDAPQP